MGLTRKDLEDPRYSEQELEELRAVIARYLQCDEWAKKTFLPVGILVTSHPGNRPYLKACLETHKKLGYWIALAYDNYFDPTVPDISYDRIMPAKDVMDMVDTFIMPHHQSWGGVLYPYFWLLKYGVNVLQDFPYIYCTNGDCILEKPENFPQLIEMLGDADIMGCGWEERGDRADFNTTAFIAKTSAIKAIMSHFEAHFIPYETFEKYTQEIGNCEARFGRAIRDLNVQQVIVPENPYNTQSHLKGYGTWYKLLGFRHIHAEHNYAYRNRGIPPEIQYFDSRFMGDEYNTIKAYWEIEDPDILERWWAK
jgi:hypothetical protein